MATATEIIGECIEAAQREGARLSDCRVADVVEAIIDSMLAIEAEFASQNPAPVIHNQVSVSPVDDKTAELVESLREGVTTSGQYDVGGSDDWDIAGANRVMSKAADRIAALEADNEALRTTILRNVDLMRKRAEAAEAENTRLRAALAQSELACVYCTLPSDEWAKCKSGFPGCARADDALGCPELGASMALSTMKAECDEVVKALRVVHDWANARCPCHEETPDPCPLCGASVERGACMSAENTIPRDILARIRFALSTLTPDASKQEGGK